MNERLEKAAAKRRPGEGESIGEMRETFVSHSVLLQQAVLLEDKVRSSVWVNMCGLGTTLWTFTTIWTFVIVLGWTFVPGVTAFHPKAASVASEAFCGAWASVFAARVTCVMSMLFLMINIVIVAIWICDKFAASSWLGHVLLQKATSMDSQMMGIPVMETIIKSIVLRGHTGDTSTAQLAVALDDKKCLKTEKAELESKLGTLNVRISSLDSQIEHMRTFAAGSSQGDIQASMEKLEAGSLEEDMAKWHDLGEKAVKIAEARAAEAAAVKQATTEEIEKIMNRVMEIAEQVRESEAMQVAVQHAEHLAEISQEYAQQGLEELKKNEDLKKYVEQGEQLAAQGMEQGKKLAAQVQESEAVKEGIAKAKEAASKMKK